MLNLYCLLYVSKLQRIVDIVINVLWEDKIMTAKEMFEKLGYERITLGEDLYLINYFVSEVDDYISFVKDKHVYVPDMSLSMDMLKAINQQCKELGWIE